MRKRALLPPLPPSAKLVAVVGRPNVGKSTLFNRLCGGHHAIVEDQPGVTRDRRYGEAEWDGRRFRVVDTGGLDPGAARESTVARGVQVQAERAIDEADLLLFVLDARDGATPSDHATADRLRRTGKPLLFVANKVDGRSHEALAAELYELGADDVIAISATHGRNLGELCDAIVARLGLPPAEVVDDELAPADETEDVDGAERVEPEIAATDRTIRLALVGRPNAGKSSLVNRLLDDERVIVDATPGTTRDPVDTPLTALGRRFMLIDTAGIRRRARVEAPMEKIAVAMAEKSIHRADVALLVVDGAEGVAEQEAKIAGLCQDEGRGLVIAFNKSDLLSKRDEAKLKEELERKVQFVSWAKVAFCSARSGKGLEGVLRAVIGVHGNLHKRTSTGELNRFFETLVTAHPPSLWNGHPVKLYYITQVQVRPPTFILSVNHPQGVHFSYRRYLTNQLRERFGFDGVPIRIICKARRSKERSGAGQPPKRAVRRGPTKR